MPYNLSSCIKETFINFAIYLNKKNLEYKIENQEIIILEVQQFSGADVAETFTHNLQL